MLLGQERHCRVPEDVRRRWHETSLSAARKFIRYIVLSEHDREPVDVLPAN